MALNQTIETSEAVGHHVAMAAEAVFELVASLRTATEELFADARRGGRRVSVADLSGIDAIAIGMLGGVDGIIPGAGFVAAPADAERRAPLAAVVAAGRTARPPGSSPNSIPAGPLLRLHPAALVRRAGQHRAAPRHRALRRLRLHATSTR